METVVILEIVKSQTVEDSFNTYPSAVSENNIL